MVGKSPVIQTRMHFDAAMKMVVEGKKVKRLEWPKDGTYLAMKDAQVCIFKPEDKQMHPLILTDGDILGTDWVLA